MMFFDEPNSFEHQYTLFPWAKKKINCVVRVTAEKTLGRVGR